MTRRLAGLGLVAVLIAAFLVVMPLPSARAAEAPPAFSLTWGTSGSGDGQFKFPDAVAVDGSGNVYVADTVNHRIQKFTSGGTYLTQWGTYGSGNGQFLNPQGIAVDGSGNVYVADTMNRRIQKFTSGGTYLTQWGTLGTGNGQFDDPRGVAVDASGNVFVADYGISRIQEFTSTGAFVTKWGTPGTGNGQFNRPFGVAVDASGNVYVADYMNSRIQKFASTGTYLTQWGTTGVGNGQFSAPFGVAVDAVGGVYVTDININRVQKFTSSGTYVTQWGTTGTGNGQFSNASGIAVDASGSVYVADYSPRIQKFVPPAWLTITKTADETTVTAGSVIHYHVTMTNAGSVPLTGVTVSDTGAPACAGSVADIAVGTNRVVDCAYTTALADIGTYANAATVVTNETTAVTSNTVNVTVTAAVPSEPPPEFLRTWGTTGSGNGQFNYPVGVAVDSSGKVYVVDSVNNRVQKFSAAGAYLTQWGSTGSGNGQFVNPRGVAVDADGNVYVTDGNNHRVQKFTSTGTYVTQWGTSGTGNGQFNAPFGVAVDAAGNVYVTDYYLNRVQRFTSTGTFLTTWGTSGTGNGQFRTPTGVAVDADGDVYVADWYNHRIQKFASTGNFLTKWGTLGSGTGTGQFTYPTGVAVDAAGNVYVTEAGNNRIQKFTSTVAYVTQWGTLGTGNGQFHAPYGVAVDASGNVYVADQLNDRIQKFGSVDTTDPTVDLRTPADGAVFDRDEVVAADYSCDDEAGGSGLDTCVGTVADGDPVDTLTLGSHDFSVIATDHEGNTRTVTHSYTVRDVTRPTVDLRTPAEGAVFDRGEVVAADYSCDDEAGGSGIDTCVGTVADGDPVPTGTLGSHDFTVTATDHAGNHRTVTHTYTVVLTGVEGTVTESPSGGPVAGVWVVGVSTAGQMTAATLTDASGGYSLALPVGSYKVEFVDVTGRHVGEWFENAPLGDFGAAQTVTVSGPTAVRVDAELAASGASGAIAGTVTESGSSVPVGGAWVVAVRSYDGRIVAGVLSRPDGTFRVGGLTEGLYRLAVIDPTMGHAYDLFFDDKADFASGDDIAVTAGAVSVVNPDLDPATPASPNATIEGAVTDTVRGDPVAGAWVAAVNKNTGVFTVATEADDAGRFSLSVPAGSYALEFIDPSGTHRGEWHHDTSLGEFSAATPVTVAAGATAVADEDLVPLTGGVVGRVVDASTGAGIRGAWVVAVRSYNGAMVAWDVTDGDGRFSVTGLDPVDHRVAVIDPTGVHEIELFYDNHSDFGHGDDLTIDPGAAPPSITVDLTPR